MRKEKVLTTIGCFLLFIVFSYDISIAQNKTSTENEAFSLKNGDRVVFLGNSLFEDDFQFGTLELALTTRFPDKEVTFRNLGWSGDDVFGDARGNFTKPPSAYELFFQHITKAEPTVVFLAFGGVESQEGEEGLPRFKDGLNKLLDKLDQLGAKSILLSPIPFISGDSSQILAGRNTRIELYSAEMAKVAAARGKKYVDVYKPISDISKKVTITEDGVHLNETGYYYLAGALEKGLGLAERTQSASIAVAKTTANATGAAKIVEVTKEGAVKFTLEEKYLPFTLSDGSEGGSSLKVSGLKKGVYVLKTNGEIVATASAKAWQDGVVIKQGPSFTTEKEVREMINRKNELFFFQYRPLNETYITGFRRYEQGRHVKGLEEQDILIKWIEGLIALKRAPKANVYQLELVK